jgi:hypothetical protein
MSTLQQRLLKAERPTVLWFASQLIHHLTIRARAHYDRPESHSALIETNEAIHRLASHLRDLTNDSEPLSDSRAAAICAHADLLTRSEAERLIASSKL